MDFEEELIQNSYQEVMMGITNDYDEGFPFIIDEDEYGNDSYDTDTFDKE